MAQYLKKEFETDNLSKSMIPSQINSRLDQKQKEFLKQIEDIERALKPFEIVSILFLLHKNAKKTYLAIDRFLRGIDSKLVSNLYLEAVENGENWEYSFYESLFIIKNYKVLKQFNIESVNAVHRFNHDYSIPDIRYALYKVCETIIGNEVEYLLKAMEKPPDLRYPEYLEFYILKWISDEKISIDNKIDVSRLIEGLKSIGQDKYAQLLLRYQNSSEPLERIFYKAVQLDDSCYPIIDPEHVGLCIIINQEKFDRNPEKPGFILNERKGTDVDCLALMNMLRKFNIETIIEKNVSSRGMLTMIRNKVCDCFKPNYSMFLLIILSHGDQGVIYGSDSKPVRISHIDFALFLPELNEKPKVMIIQACQGDFFVKAPKIEEPKTNNSLPFTESSIESDAPKIVKQWPTDTLICMATIPFFASYRHTEKGTWYIQTLCDIFNRNPDDSIYDLLNKVNNSLKTNPVFNTEESIRLISEFQSRLSKKLYLKPHNP